MLPAKSYHLKAVSFGLTAFPQSYIIVSETNDVEEETMREELIRTEMLLGERAMQKLAGARVAVFGIGGVGGYAAEALVRSGIGAIDLIDNDTVSISNLNRQILSLHSTIGKYKVDVAVERFLDINPQLKIHCSKTFVLPENISEFDFSNYNYVIDATDTVTAKICLIQKARESDTPIISSMGTGNKLDPTKLQIADISKTSMCPLARVMRKELRARGINHLKVLYSTEEPLNVCAKSEPSPDSIDAQIIRRKDFPGSTAFVPPAGGLIIASEVVRDLIR